MTAGSAQRPRKLLSTFLSALCLVGGTQYWVGKVGTASQYAQRDRDNCQMSPGMGLIFTKNNWRGGGAGHF